MIFKENQAEKLPGQLVEPSAQYEDSYVAGILEFQALGEKGQKSIDELTEDLRTYLADRRFNTIGRKDEEVEQLNLWFIADGKFVGQVFLTPNIDDLAFGNLGYEVVPSQRRKGYATEMLRLALMKARELGMQRAVLVCREDNSASRKVIETNGGVYKGAVFPAGLNMKCLRFSIPLSGDSGE